MAAQIKSVVPNAFSHSNKRYDSLINSRTQEYRPLLELEVGVPKPRGHLGCRQISFADFCRIPFPNDVP